MLPYCGERALSGLLPRTVSLAWAVVEPRVFFMVINCCLLCWLLHRLLGTCSLTLFYRKDHRGPRISLNFWRRARMEKAFLLGHITAWRQTRPEPRRFQHKALPCFSLSSVNSALTIHRAASVCYVLCNCTELEMCIDIRYHGM